jgi:hypothetical protein
VVGKVEKTETERLVIEVDDWLLFDYCLPCTVLVRECLEFGD